MTSNSQGQREARKLVEGIAKKHGYVRQEVLDRMSVEDRAEVVEAMFMKDQLIASTVTTLAKNLYTSKARFVFELLQNAEDNHFNRAHAHKKAPYVRFHVFPDRIVQECNEDGFTPENLTAICNVGKSSKTGAQGYVGEKGIGFKSVFMAAYKAYIQSGHFSFYFEHRSTDSGMGMITPHWQDHDEKLGDQLTRITLFLYDRETAEELEKQRQIIRKQFEEIHDAILLFMRKIEKIEIVFHDNKSDETEATKIVIFSIDRGHETRVVVHKSTTADGHTDEDLKYYHTTKHIATNLAKNENRTYSKEEEESRAYSTAEVILAFPLTSSHDPEIDDQWLFAFLPVRQLGFKFLIQADFVTQANRQDIVTTSARNEALVDGIAEAFIRGVKQMCEHPTLIYKWMRYLPRENDYPWDSFWSSLIDKIGKKLSVLAVLAPANRSFSSPLKTIEDSRRHSPLELDKFGRPLFADIEPNLYLSLEYDYEDLKLLFSHGLKCTTMVEIVARAAWDLKQKDSRIKCNADENWQSRAARVLMHPWKEGYFQRQKEIKALELLPLRTGSWTSAANSMVYFPRVEGTDLDIPLGVHWKVVRPEAVANVNRHNLFKLVGVKYASVFEVREAIIEKYDRNNSILSHPDPKDAANELNFLYLTHHLVDGDYEYDAVQLLSSNKLLWRHTDHCIYIQDNQPYGPGELLRNLPAGELLKRGAPGFSVTFMHIAYFEQVPKPPTDKSEQWKEWLYRWFHVRRHLPLVDSSGRKLSDISRYISIHRPEKFMGYLKAVWEREKPNFDSEGSVIKQLGKVEVPCCRKGITQTKELNDAYLPLQDLLDLCDQFLLGSEFFPFLDLETPLSHGARPQEWEALGKAFGLGLDKLDPVEFSMDILYYLQLGNEDAETCEALDEVCNLYTHILGKIRGGPKKYENYQIMIKDKFERYSFIFVPESDDGGGEWASPEDCVWMAPSGLQMTSKFALSGLYLNHFSDFEANKNLLHEFFVKKVQVAPKCTWGDLIDEIKNFKTSKSDDFDRISKIYECLADMHVIAITKEELRETFANEALIYNSDSRSNQWYKTSECLWSSFTSIRGMFVINNQYEQLRDFFVEVLGVESMTAKMVYDKLAARDASQLPRQEIKDTILALSPLLDREGSSFDPAPVMDNAIFPVILPTGEKQLRTASQSFAIRDRKHLAEDFEKEAVFFDFSMELVRDLRGFISWAGLEKRYLSEAVKEISSVDVTSARPVSLPDRQIKTKAYALVRIAKNFRCVRAYAEEELYTLLQNCETLETDSITSELHLFQDERLLKVVKEAAMLHIREDKDFGLKIYIPRDETKQEICYTSKLSRRLCEWLMTNPDTQILDYVPPQALTVVQSVLGARSVAVAGVLDELGILPVDFPEVGQGDIGGSTGFDPEDIVVQVTQSSSSLAVSRSPRQSNRTSSTPSTRVSTPQPSPTTSYDSVQNGYTRLLRKVVENAKETVFPSQGVFDMSAIQDALESDEPESDDEGEDPYYLRSTNKLERNKKVGAAGQLFVFQWLSQLELPDFGPNNWKSSIRSYVRSHPDYADIADTSIRNERETIDFVYDDVQSVLTRLLIDKGYLSSSDTWTETTIKYSMEVKTTTRACGTPFYLTRSQFKSMQEQSNNNSSVRKTEEIYIIFRVYNLESDSVGVRVLVDPETMRQNAKLDFSTETWSVVVKG